MLAPFARHLIAAPHFRSPWLCLALVCLLLPTAELAAQPAVDFKRDIQPIFAAHCWKCHGEKKAMGGLRLDERSFAEQGGGSGKNLLEPAVHRNELLRRVKSKFDSERMPSEGPPLSQSQIDTLERWIVQGAAWPEPPPSKEEQNAARQDTFDLWFDRLAYITTGRYLPAYGFAMAILIAMIFVERAKRARLEGTLAASGWRRTWQRRLMRISRAWYLVAFLGVALFVAVQFSREQAGELAHGRKHSLAQQRSNQLQAGLKRHHEPLRPMHPPRLGGRYYRGNDERSAELFNGGFYRTATFDIHLADAEGRHLAWGDSVPDQPHLHFVIERSAHSSPTLFTPEIMESSGLSAMQPEQREHVATVPFLSLRADIPGERWSLLFPLEPIPTQGRLSGKVYLYKGQPGDTAHRHDDPSYLIGYELSAENGVIGRESHIWMASVYNVPQLQWPETGQIPADQWFDFRPIPEIEQDTPAK